MAAQQFRSAFRGFNREDVVHYIEYLNNQHNAVVEQLNNQLQNAPKTNTVNEELQAQLTAALERCAQLEAQLAAMPAAVSTTEEELEAYRRAERTERIARERAELVYHQVNGILADATAKVDGVASEIGTVAEQVMPLLYQLQAAVSGSKQTLQDAASTMYAIKPNN